MSRKQFWTISTALLLICGTLWLFRALRGRPHLQFDGVREAKAERWSEYGGLWDLRNSEIQNRSDEEGAKLVSESPHWRNVVFSADMRMLRSHGEIGLLIRGSNMDTGINAFRGYYAGYRSMDNALVLGFADRDWLETKPVFLQKTPQTSEWMHLEVIAFDCDIAAELRISSTGQVVRSLMHMQACTPEGVIGLRSMGTGAMWRNIHAGEVTKGEVSERLHSFPAAEAAIYPKREDDVDRMRLAQDQGMTDRYISDFVNEGEDRSAMRVLETAKTIASLKASSIRGEDSVTVQGAVTQVDPLYVQEGGSGLEVHSSVATLLSLGDEVAFTGNVQHQAGKTFLQASSQHVLWDHASPRPVAAPADRLASGAFDGTLVELDAIVLSRMRLPDGRVQLLLEAGAEQFAVLVEPGLSRRSAANWETGSTLRVRGVCSAERDNLPGAALFTLLPRSVADVQLISTPPWNSGWRLGLLLLAAAGVLCVIALIFLRAESWKMRKLYEERERLAADMHDTLAQGFAGVGYQLQSLRRGMRDSATVPPNLLSKLDIACDLATETHREASTRITALHFSAEEKIKPLEVLRRSAMLMQGREFSLEVHTTERGIPRDLPLATRDALLRIGQEAIANVLRHSEATRMTIRLAYDAKSVNLEVEDDGLGFVEQSEGFGIMSMQNRAKECQGSLSIRTAPGRGTTVRAELPCDPDEPFWQKTRKALTRHSHKAWSRSDFSF